MEASLNNKKIIGLSGTNGAGKDTVGIFCAEHYNYLFISVTDLLRNEATKRGLPVEREVLRTISTEWRRQSGLGVLVDKAFNKYEQHKDKYVGVIMASMRNPGEADRIHELGGIVVWIDADPQLRYQRVQSNKADRGRQQEDNKTFDQFIAEEKAEMSSSGDAATLDMLAVKQKSDVFINNSYDNLDTFNKDIEASLQL
jgi:dephospho-CoA kinase